MENLTFTIDFSSICQVISAIKDYPSLNFLWILVRSAVLFIGGIYYIGLFMLISAFLTRKWENENACLALYQVAFGVALFSYCYAVFMIFKFD